MRKFVVVAVLAVMATGVLAATAGAQANPPCGTTLYSSLTLSGNMDCSGYTGGPALMVGAPGITINLNGFTLKGPGGSAGTAGIAFNWVNTGQAFANVKIKNGTIEYFADDVYIFGANSPTLTSLTLLLDGSESYTGVYSQFVAGGTLSHLSVSNAYDGIYEQYNAQLTVSHSTLNGNLYGASGQNNTAISFDTVQANGNGNGFVFFSDDRDQFNSNTANGNSSSGFYTQCNGVVFYQGNTASSNGGDGIDVIACFHDPEVQPTTSVKQNTTNSNGGDGIFDYDSVAATYQSNIANSNAAYGINIQFPQRDTINNNTASWNGLTGIYLYQNFSYYNALSTSSNTANHNGYYGLYADYAVPGKGNNARYNTPFDCWNWVCSPGSTIPSSAPAAPRHSGPAKAVPTPIPVGKS